MRHLAAILVFLVACSQVPGDIPRSPSYQGCTPSHSFFEQLAESTTFLSSPSTMPRDPADALSDAEQWFGDRHVRIIPKIDGLDEDWASVTTALPTDVLVARDFSQRTPLQQSVLLWHERVHLRQFDELGLTRFARIYLVAEGRWALEVQAYREGFRLLRRFGAQEADLESWYEEEADGLYDTYRMDLMPRECAQEKAVEVWHLDEGAE